MKRTLENPFNPTDTSAEPKSKERKTEVFDSSISTAMETDLPFNPLLSLNIEPGTITVESKEKDAKIKEVSQNNRRLDSFARLLEGDGICAAVCYVDDTLFVTSNSVYALKDDKVPKHDTAKFMENVLDYFASLDSTKKIDENNRVGVLEEICMRWILAPLKGQDSDYGNCLKSTGKEGKNILSNIVSTLLTSSTSEWMPKTDLNYFVEHLSDTDKRIWTGMQNKKNKFTEEERRVRTKLTYIQRAYGACSHLVRDYKKVEKFLKEKKVKDFRLLAVGKEGEHAEMRMIGYLLSVAKLSGEAKEPYYVGISKLCCKDCQKVVKAINEAKGSKDEGVAVTSPDDEEAKAFDQARIETRGIHGLDFGKNWVISSYLYTNESSKTYCAGKRYYSAKKGNRDNWEQFPAGKSGQPLEKTSDPSFGEKVGGEYKKIITSGRLFQLALELPKNPEGDTVFVIKEEKKEKAKKKKDAEKIQKKSFEYKISYCERGDRKDCVLSKKKGQEELFKKLNTLKEGEVKDLEILKLASDVLSKQQAQQPKMDGEAETRADMRPVYSESSVEESPKKARAQYATTEEDSEFLKIASTITFESLSDDAAEKGLGEAYTARR